MEMYQLRYFCTLAKYGHFLRAAEALFISPSTLTTAVKKLETEIDLPLIDRTAPDFTLTDAGKLFLQKAEPIIASVEDLQQDLRDLRLNRNVVTLYVDHSLNNISMSNYLDYYRHDHPEISIWLIWRDTASIQSSLLKQPNCFGILPNLSYDSRYEVISYRKEPLLLYIPFSHPLSALSAVTGADLAPYIDELLNTSEPLLLSMLEERGVTAGNARLTLTSNDMIKTAVENEKGIAILPEAVSEPDHDINVLPFDPAMEMEYVFVYSAQQPLTSQMRSLMRFLKVPYVKQI